MNKEVRRVAERCGERDVWERKVGPVTPAVQAMVNSGPEVAEDIFDGSAVDFCRVGGVLAQFNCGKGDIGMAGDHGPDEFANGLAVGESKLVGKFGAFGVSGWRGGLFELLEVGGVA